MFPGACRDSVLIIPHMQLRTVGGMHGGQSVRAGSLLADNHAFSESHRDKTLSHPPTLRPMKDMPTPMSPLELQQVTNGSDGRAQFHNMSLSEQLAILQQHHMRIQRQQQEVAAKLAISTPVSKLRSSAFSHFQASTQQDAAPAQPATSGPTIDAFAKLRQRVLAQQQIDYHQHTKAQQSHKSQAADHDTPERQPQQRDHETVNASIPSPISPPLTSTRPRRISHSSRVGDLRHHILMNNQQLVMASADRSSNISNQIHSDSGDCLPADIDRQHQDRKHLQVRRLEEEENSGSDATPFVSPSLTYTSRTPSTLSPSTPSFDSYTPPSQSAPSNGSTPIHIHNEASSTLVKSQLVMGHAVEVSSSPAQTTSPNTTHASARHPSQDGQH